ncbi:MAG: L-aspartate oxidase [Bacteroidales bacterium]|nr:L-aspartate oxidase [Bacteroidales bacterium]
MKKHTEFLVIGSGIAGLSYALKVAQYGKVIILTKTDLEKTNTSYAQGGIAAVTDRLDSYEKHIEDTLIAGAYLNDEATVRMVVKRAPEAINSLMQWGTKFDTTSDGSLDLAKEGGHSAHRILHHKDNTGFEIQRALTQQVKKHPNIEVLEHHFAIDILTQHHLGQELRRKTGGVVCYGAYALDLETDVVHTILAKNTFIATGGIGNIYQTTTNPEIATGDGIAMVYRAKGIIENMEFVQFHPTALYNANDRPSFLITEALRGAGAVLRNHKGFAFMDKYDKRASLAPRDIVARAIDNEMKLSGKNFVYLDGTSITNATWHEHFPNIYKKCKSLGIDVLRDYIPVAPAAHYLVGGIKVGHDACTTIRNLFAAGEVTSTGLHGANRLASNSLIEAIVYAEIAAENSVKKLCESEYNEAIPEWDYKGTTQTEEMILITQSHKELMQIMSNYVGIVRSDLRLERAFKRLEIIYEETESLYRRSIISKEICELRNAINISYLTIKMAMDRKKSIGLHYNIDHP